jgi:hypothetical protein
MRVEPRAAAANPPERVRRITNLLSKFSGR